MLNSSSQSSNSGEIAELRKSARKSRHSAVWLTGPALIDLSLVVVEKYPQLASGPSATGDHRISDRHQRRRPKQDGKPFVTAARSLLNRNHFHAKAK